MDINPINNPELFSPESRTATIYPVVAIMMTVAAAAVGLRLYTRAVILKLVGIDDWLALVSLTSFFALSIATFVLAGKGLGRHIGTLPQPDGFIEYLKVFWTTLVLYNVSITSVKLCFLAQYYRIMAINRMRIAVIVVAGIVGVWSFSQLFLAIFQCSPVWGFWDRRPDTKCLDATIGWYSNAAGNIIADVLILLLPLPMIKGLNLPRNQKLVLAGVFCLGLFTCAISITRIRFLRMTIDTTWDTLEAQLWSLAEPCSGIVCAALPTLRPLATKCFPTIFASSRANGSSYRMGSNWRPKDIESTHRSRATRRGTQQFTNTAAAASSSPENEDERRIYHARVGSAIGGTYLELSDSHDSIELDDTSPGSAAAAADHDKDRDGGHGYDAGLAITSLSYPDAIYAGPMLGGPPSRVEIQGGEAFRTSHNKGETKGRSIRVKHDIVVNHGEY